MTHLGELKHKIEYNDFGDASIVVWYEDLWEVKEVNFYEPAHGDTEDAVVERCKRELDGRLFEIYKLLRAHFEAGH